MKTLTSEQARAHALATGGELVIGSRHFNSGRAHVPARPITAAPPPPAARAAPAPVAESFTRSDVERMLAEQEARFTKLMTSLVREDAGEEEYPMCAVGFKPEYDKDGAITFVGVEYKRLE